MNVKNRLRHLAKQAGKDSISLESICRLAKECNGVVITDSLTTAIHITRKYGAIAKPFDTNMDGLIGPFFFDPVALEKAFHQAANKIESLEAKLPPEPEDEEVKCGAV